MKDLVKSLAVKASEAKDGTEASLYANASKTLAEADYMINTVHVDLRERKDV